MKAKSVKDSTATMTELVMPNDTNPLGKLMGGNLMRWMDIASSICASKHCGLHAVTASVDNLSFRSPIQMGDVITITANVTRAFHTSVEIHVEVFANNMLGENYRKSNHAYFTFVGLDSKTNRPSPVPPVQPETEEEKRLYDGASKRRELRLVLTGRMKVADATEIKNLFINE